MIKSLLSFLFFLLLGLSGFAQDRELKYSEDPQVFIEQIKLDLQKTGVPDADAYVSSLCEASIG